MPKTPKSYINFGRFQKAFKGDLLYLKREKIHLMKFKRFGWILKHINTHTKNCGVNTRNNQLSLIFKLKLSIIIIIKTILTKIV